MQGKVASNDFQIRFGLVTLGGSLVQRILDKANKATSLRIVCPVCAEPSEKGPGIAAKGDQQYVCSVDPNHTFTSGEARRAKPVGTGKNETLQLLTPAEVAALGQTKDDLHNLLELTAYPLDEIGPFLVRDGASYGFVPDDRAKKAAVVLIEILKNNPGFAFCGVTVLQSEQWMWVTVDTDDRIYIHSLVWPEKVADLHPGLKEAPRPSDAENDLAQMLVERITQPFDPEAIRSSARARHGALVASLLSGDRSEALVTAGAALPTIEDDLTALLAASIAAKDENGAT